MSVRTNGRRRQAVARWHLQNYQLQTVAIEDVSRHEMPNNGPGLAKPGHRYTDVKDAATGCRKVKI